MRQAPWRCPREGKDFPEGKATRPRLTEGRPGSMDCLCPNFETCGSQPGYLRSPSLSMTCWYRSGFRRFRYSSKRFRFPTMSNKPRREAWSLR